MALKLIQSNEQGKRRVQAVMAGIWPQMRKN